VVTVGVVGVNYMAGKYHIEECNIYVVTVGAVGVNIGYKQEKLL
jgi:hypothetical protein